jgi:hypothetical protein
MLKRIKKIKSLKSLPKLLSMISIESFLWLYYHERRKRDHDLTGKQIQTLKKKYKHTSIILIGGLGGFHFSPHLEKSLRQVTGGEIWSLGKGKRARIKKNEDGIWRCGSGEYALNGWNKEVAIVWLRLIKVIKHSETIRDSKNTIILGHSSGGLINYSLGIFRELGSKKFLELYQKEFPGISRIPKKDLTLLKQWLNNSTFVAINTPFRGICQRLLSMSSKVLAPNIVSVLNEEYLSGIFKLSGIDPIDVVDLATHSEVAETNKHHKSYPAASSIAHFLRLVSRIQQRGPNDGFVPKESAYLQEDSPHPKKDLNLGFKDHRDVIEQVDAGYKILMQLLEV